MARKKTTAARADVARSATAVASVVELQIQRRIGVVAVELSLAANQVLRDEFGFTPDQLLHFQQLLTARARANREAVQ
jgi:hypothetical protein